MQKLYYTMGEVARMFEVNASLIRFWEKEFDIINPKKSKKGNRLFTNEDIDNLKIIYHLVKEKGFTLKGAKDEIRQSRKEIEERIALITTMEKTRSFLLNIREKL
ncbi:MAG: MerR family transcriptional regulator [Bacteroidales bacterium]|nr:MerR family transcriptional regulator [Bacteroidales bacterium]